ncbi:MAG: zinc-ribbon domain-containing protein, partial [Deferrisomatales bacterium]|nr:zinc-ribbon domain-containing protein [Deferrisomatales bacterium]
MRVACNRCQVKFDVPEERLAAGAVKVRCSECGNTFVVRRRARPTEESAAEPSPVAAAMGEADAPAPEASFDDFDFAGFKGSDDLGEPLPVAAAEAPEVDAVPGSGEELPSIGELDLGDFGGLDDDLSSLEDLDLGSLEDELPGDALELEEPLERVRREDLVSTPPPRGVPVQGVADDMPRLDIQRGPRRPEGGAKSPVIASDRRHSPLLWVVIVVAVAALGFS